MCSPRLASARDKKVRVLVGIAFFSQASAADEAQSS